ncbi:mucoidy inhibitor MuiA family protein [Rhodobacteraceae bacterium G21628-S1]|nr:mucoidy inhibitor MuiA family protein [Rhodobacteraceae bacterium G21628-S1]
MRFVLSSVLVGAAALLSTTALAETFSATSRVSAVTVYPSEALITRTAEVTLPAGRHRIVISGMPFVDEIESLRISHPGVRRIGLYLRESFPVLEDASTPEQEAAEARVADIEDQIDALRRTSEEARLAAEGAEAAIAFLNALNRGEGAALPDPDQLRALVSTVREETAEARETILRAKAQERGFQRQLKDLEAELARAQAELQALSQQDEEQMFLALDVEADEEVTVPLSLSYPNDAVSWGPSYEFNLETGVRPQVTLRRDVMIQQATGEDWVDVALRVSTSTPDQRINPHDLRPNRRWIEDEQPAISRFTSGGSQVMSDVAELAVEAPVMAKEAGSSFGVVASEAGVSYSFDVPVSLRSGAELAYLNLPDVTFSAEVSARAAPRRDPTAFRIARIVNTSGEELLASANSRFLVDGELIGSGYFVGLTPEAERDLGFGPIDGLRIKRDLLDQSEGGRGVISRSNQRDTVAEIEVENLTGQVWPLRVLDLVPFSEQEDLEITWSAKPTPSEENVDKQRGILAWDLEMQPGETRVITLITRLGWPEGKVLR